MKTLLLSALALALSFSPAAAVPFAFSGYLYSLTDFNNMTLNGIADDGATFNSDVASMPANTCFLLPAGMMIGTSVKLRLTLSGQCLVFGPGSAIVALTTMGNVGDVFDFAADNTWTRDMEIDCDAGNVNAISGWRTTGDRTGIRLLGKTIAKDCTQYGGHFTAGGNILIEDYTSSATLFDGFHGQNAGTTADATITIMRATIDRTTINASTCAHNAITIFGTAAHYTHLFLGDVKIDLPDNPTGATCNGIETLFTDGHMNKGIVTGGGIDYSFADGTQRFTADQLEGYGPNIACIEVANSTSTTTTHDVSIGGPYVCYGKNSAGTLRMQRGIAVDGLNDSHKIAFGTGVISGFSDDGAGVFATPVNNGTNNNITDVSFGNTIIDASDVNGAGHGFLDGFHARANKVGTAIGSITGLSLGKMSILGSDAPTSAVILENVAKVTGDVSAQGVHTAGGALVTLNNDGNVLGTMDNIDLNVMDLGSNPTSAQLAVTKTNGGLLGSNISVGSASFIPYAAGFTGKVRNVSTKLWSSYSSASTAPESTLDGAIGSVTSLASGGQYYKTTSAGTLTGWKLFIDASASLYGNTILVGSGAPTASTGELVGQKITATTSAPGAGFAKMEWVASTGGSCKLIAYAGTSSTPVTIVDLVGSGC